MELTDSVTKIAGVGSIMAGKLAKLDVFTVFDLLNHLPFRYEDRRTVNSAKSVRAGEHVVVIGKISKIATVVTKNGKRMQTATITDSSGSLRVMWFNQIYLLRAIPPDSEVALFGKVSFFDKKPALISPEYEFVNAEASIHLRRLVPVYPETAGLSSKWLRTKIYNLLNSDAVIKLLGRLGEETALPLHQSFQTVHFPNDLDQVATARSKLAYLELVLLHLSAQIRRSSWLRTHLTHTLSIDQNKITEFVTHLPFQLTNSQSQAIADVLADLQKSKPMNRLVLGDVGSGKTVVAAIAAYASYLNGFKTVIMAPTQILANQHFETLNTLYRPLGIQVDILTGSRKTSSDTSQIIVGTQALLNSKLDLNEVGLVVIDEQHRFGVAQRALAARQGQSTHVLTMSATPIPRTIALAKYGDLDLTQMTDLPKGRLRVKTWVVPEEKRIKAHDWIAEQLTTENSQCFWVCPFIDASESMATVKAVKTEFDQLKKVFKKHKLGLLHGKLKAKEKDAVIDQFRAKKLDLLVTTPVVEVGVDIPNAAIMVIEGADRFGLASLHQLRGRVGRAGQQAYCLLFADHITPRLKAMETRYVGSDLAEIDLKLRGPGELFGQAQHGHNEFKIVSYDDFKLIQPAQAQAEKLVIKIKSYPLLRSLLDKGKIDPVRPN